MPKSNPLTQGLEQTTPRKRKAAKQSSAATLNITPRTRVLVAGHFQPAVQKQLRMMAAEQSTTVQALLTEALNMLFAKHRKPEIAGSTGR
jgi:hypothetical protein